MKFAYAAAVFAAGIVLSTARPAAAQETAGSAPACFAPEAVPGPVLEAPFLVLGEVHGTREVPEFVAAYLCSAAQQRRKLTLALEYPAAEQNAIDAFMASGGTSQDSGRLTATAFWRRPFQDGRTSIGMLHMLERVRALRAGGADINVIGIDGDAPARRDAFMADRLRAELGQGADRQLVALIGGLHAVRGKGSRFNPRYESAIYRLADKRPLALTVGTAGGTAWVCQGGAPASCHAAAWDINRVTPAPATPFSLVPPSAQFDGVFFVGATTASPPAVSGSQ